MSGIMKIAILTDIHAYAAASGDSPSWINLNDDQSNPKTNPFFGLQEFVTRAALSADLVVCCGDLGDKASPEGQQYVWQEVNKLAHCLKARRVVATAGNHDVDSRFKSTKYDARGQLQALSPPFPITDQLKWMEYWAKNYTYLDEDGVRFLVLNSAAYHGYQDPNGPPEFLHGRVSDRTLDRLRAELPLQGRRAANVLVCHHHPLKNDQIKLTDYSEMKNGDQLINALVDSSVGPWLVIHGHKHLPRLIYAPGGSTAPTIFSAGSFSAKLYPEYGSKARNEFYIMELEVPLSVGQTSTLKGMISTWEWTYGNGWQRARNGAGLGRSAAFGARLDVAEEAYRIASLFKSHSGGLSASWAEVCAASPLLKYMVPEDLSAFLNHLQNDHAIVPLHDSNGEVSELQVRRHG